MARSVRMDSSSHVSTQTSECMRWLWRQYGSIISPGSDFRSQLHSSRECRSRSVLPPRSRARRSRLELQSSAMSSCFARDPGSNIIRTLIVLCQAEFLLTKRIRVVGEANLDEPKDPTTQEQSAGAVTMVSYVEFSGTKDFHQGLTGCPGQKENAASIWILALTAWA